jgi:K+-sensing histidine kinase KdpD
MFDELSHGLRTPLTSVLGFTATLLDRWDEMDESERIALLRVVYGEAVRMAHSVEQIDRELYVAFADVEPHFRPSLVMASAS